MPPAKRLPGKIAKRFRKNQKRDGDDEAYWEEVAAKNSNNTSTTNIDQSTLSKQAEDILSVPKKEGEVTTIKSANLNNGTSQRKKEKQQQKKMKPQKSAITKAKPKGASIFCKSTSLAEWNPKGGGSGRKYNIRYLRGDTCASVPWILSDHWVQIHTLDDEGNLRMHYVIGVVSVVNMNNDRKNKNGTVVGVWASDADDSEIEFYCTNDYEFVDDFQDLSFELCRNICPEMEEVFNDGSGNGICRQPKLVSPSVLSELNSWYMAW